MQAEAVEPRGEGCAAITAQCLYLQRREKRRVKKTSSAAPGCSDGSSSVYGTCRQFHVTPELDWFGQRLNLIKQFKKNILIYVEYLLQR